MPNDYDNKLDSAELIADPIADPETPPDRTVVSRHLPPSLDSKYEKLGVVGSGGMATVIKARHRITNQIVAIKLLHEQTQSNLKRFKQEASTISRLSHPNIVTMHDFGIEENTAYLITEFIDGESLAEQIARQEPMDETRFRHLFGQICDGLEHAHRNGVIHRDLKPANVLVFKRDGVEVVKLCDFGIAKVTVSDTAQNLTQTGEILGTPLYMSPEQSMGQAAKPSSDIYSLGCIMYECLAYRPPIAGENFLETVHRRLNNKPKTFTELGVNVPQSMERIAMRCLEIEPEQRTQSASQLKAELNGSVPPPLTATNRKFSGFRVPAFVYVTLGLFLVLGMYMGVMLGGKSPAPRAPVMSTPSTATASHDPVAVEGVDKLKFSASIESSLAGRSDRSHTFYEAGTLSADDYGKLQSTALVKSIESEWKAYYNGIFDAVKPPDGARIPKDVRFKINATVTPGAKLVAKVEWQDPTTNSQAKQFTSDMLKKLSSLNNSTLLRFPAKSQGVSFSIYADDSDNSIKLDGEPQGLISQ